MSPKFDRYQADIDAIIKASLSAANPAAAVRRYLTRQSNFLNAGSFTFDLDKGRVFLAAFGKAAIPMATAAAEIIGDRLEKGIAITKKGQLARVNHPAIITREAAHPISDQSSVEAAADVFTLLEGLSSSDLVIFLVSGGASALVSKPLLPLSEWQELTEKLLMSGCSIHELNTVRKQLDSVKGGGLLNAAQPASVLNLILSDVIGNPLDKIGSGPTVPNPESEREAMEVMARYNLLTGRLEMILKDRASAPHSQETPPSIIVGDIRQAAEAGLREAETRGFNPYLLSWHLEGEASEAGKFSAALAKSADSCSCLMLGGETTVTIRGNGIGGRNLEVALAAGIALEKFPNRVVATLATDGDDGPTGAAGAIVTGNTVDIARSFGLNPYEALRRNDSYTFFKSLEEQTAERQLLITGQTGTNVNDLIIILSYPS